MSRVKSRGRHLPTVPGRSPAGVPPLQRRQRLESEAGFGRQTTKRCASSPSGGGGGGGGLGAVREGEGDDRPGAGGVLVQKPSRRTLPRPPAQGRKWARGGAGGRVWGCQDGSSGSAALGDVSGGGIRTSEHDLVKRSPSLSPVVDYGREEVADTLHMGGDARLGHVSRCTQACRQEGGCALHAAECTAGSLRVRFAPGVCRLRHDQMGQGPTEPHAGRSTFLLSSGGAGGGYY